MPATKLRTAVDTNAELRHRLLSFVQALHIQYSQSVLYNTRHELDERLCRWLLLTHDRLDADLIPVTHNVLSTLLDVRRARITEGLAKLEITGAIRRRRRAIEQ
jgi:CRP-like cAMP-binding protein